jgi:hypothetical protein
MTAGRQQLTDVVEILASLIRNIHLRRALHEVCPAPKLNFWRVIYGDLTDFAVLEWCKLFGSDDEGRQPTHWKNVVSDQKQFRADLLSHLKVSPQQFSEYWRTMKKYRDMEVAHRDPRRREILKYPTFGVALESAYFYYDFVRGELDKRGVKQDQKSIRQYAASFASQSKKIAAAAMEATKSISETVY